MMTGKVYFKLEKVADERTGVEVDSLFKYTEQLDYGPMEPAKEYWCNVQEIDRLFATCQERWGSNWNLEKVCVAIAESEID